MGIGFSTRAFMLEEDLPLQASSTNKTPATHSAGMIENENERCI
jgi:hypothetical protein